MKKKKYQMKRRTKAIIGLIVCIILAAVNIAFSSYTWTKQAALENLMEYHSTGELETVTPLPDLMIKSKANYRFYLMENERCFALFSVNWNLWYGWFDGPCLIVEKDSSKPIVAAYNSYTSADDADKEMMRVFGLVNDKDIKSVEVDIVFAVTGAGQTLNKLTLKTAQYFEYDGQLYFNIDHVYTDKLSEVLMPPFTVRGYNDAGELIYSEEFTYGQSTSIG